MTEPKRPPFDPHAQWTTATLIYYFEQRFTALEKTIDDRFAEREKAFNASLIAAKEAVDKADSALEKRFEGVNEFRDALNDQQQRLVTRKEYNTAHENITLRVGDLQDRMNRSEGKGQGLNTGWLYLVAGIGAVGTLVTMIVVLYRLKNGG